MYIADIKKRDSIALKKKKETGEDTSSHTIIQSSRLLIQKSYLRILHWKTVLTTTVHMNQEVWINCLKHAWCRLTSFNCGSFLWLMLQVQQEFHNSGLMTDVDLDPGCTLNKKIRNAQLAQYNFILGQWQHTPSVTYSSLSLLLSLPHRLSRYWFPFFVLFASFSTWKKWWEKRRRPATL